MKDCGLFNPHDWNKWEPYLIDVSLVGTAEYNLGKTISKGQEEWQKRTCKKCGKTQREKI